MSAKAIKLLDLSPNFYQTRARSLLITVDDEDCVANNLLQIGMVIELNSLKIEIAKLNLGQYSKAMFGQDFKFKFSRDADVRLRF